MVEPVHTRGMSEAKNTALGSAAQSGYSHGVQMPDANHLQPPLPMIAVTFILLGLVLFTILDSSEAEPR